MPVEDNAFAMLKTPSGQVAWLRASWPEWKNLFSFEILGRHGKLQIDGLGGSYGTERLTNYRMLPELGPPETSAWEDAGPDQSWQAECAHFVDCIEQGTHPSGGLADALAALAIVGRVRGGPRVIISRSPLRVTPVGALPTCRRTTSATAAFWLRPAIDMYVYITMHETFVDDRIVKCSRLERVREAAYVVAAVALLVSVLTMRSSRAASTRGDSRPVAKTASNGTA